MEEKFVRVLAGYKTEDDVFVVKMEEIVPEKDLKYFFRRNPDFCCSPVVKLATTNLRKR